MPPPTTARVAPADLVKMDDGHSTKIAFALDPDLGVFEVSVTPPGIDTGDLIDSSTMWNTAWRTFAGRALRSLTDSTFTARYNKSAFSQIVAIAGSEGGVTIHFPIAGLTLDYWGVLRVAEFGELVEGTPPELTGTISATNKDPATGAEEAPVLTVPVSPAVFASLEEREQAAGDLTQYSLADLNELAAREGAPLFGKKRKDAVIEAIRTHREAVKFKHNKVIVRYVPSGRDDPVRTEESEAENEDDDDKTA